MVEPLPNHITEVEELGDLIYGAEDEDEEEPS